MAKDGSISMPGVFGGLMRYNEEYESKIKITATQVIIFVVAFALGVVLLKLFLPIGV
ncbi:MAG: preprotein translocase subunit Sec61beta [Nanoarchaeota archaeon]